MIWPPNYADDLEHTCDGCSKQLPGDWITYRRFYSPSGCSIELELCKRCDLLLLAGMGAPVSIIAEQAEIEEKENEGC